MKIQIEIIYSYRCNHCRRMVICNSAAIPAVGAKVPCPYCRNTNIVEAITGNAFPLGEKAHETVLFSKEAS